NAVPIDTEFDSQRKRRDAPLKTVGHVIADAAARFGVLEGKCSLYLPEGLEVPIDFERNDDGSLFAFTLISDITCFTDGRHPLIIKAETCK
ncbi:hypothetical protein HK100_009343, partial [Physocladia obscura]